MASIKTSKHATTMLGEPIQFLTVSQSKPDVYNDKKDPLPERWRAVPESFKKAQWVGSNVPPQPHGSKGFFSSPAHAKVVKSRGGEEKVVVDDFLDKTKYAGAARPKHGVSFGSNDASRRDQFTQFIEQERYRERLRGEAKFLRRTAAAAAAAGGPVKSGMTAAETLRSMNTGRRWGPARKMGTWSTASDDIGFGMDEVKFSSPRRGKVSTTAQFHNSGHLAVGGAGAGDA